MSKYGPGIPSSTLGHMTQQTRSMIGRDIVAALRRRIVTIVVQLLTTDYTINFILVLTLRSLVFLVYVYGVCCVV